MDTRKLIYDHLYLVEFFEGPLLLHTLFGKKYVLETAIHHFWALITKPWFCRLLKYACFQSWALESWFITIYKLKIVSLIFLGHSHILQLAINFPGIKIRKLSGSCLCVLNYKIILHNVYLLFASGRVFETSVCMIQPMRSRFGVGSEENKKKKTDKMSMSRESRSKELRSRGRSRKLASKKQRPWSLSREWD